MGNDKTQKKRVYWGKEKEVLIYNIEEEINQKQGSKKVKLKQELDKRRLELYAYNDDKDGIITYCEEVLESESTEHNEKKYGETEKEQVSCLLSSFDYCVFKKACMHSKVEFIQFLVQILTKEDLQKNISFNNFENFRSYLSGSKLLYLKQQYSTENLIVSIKILLSVIDDIPNALNIYIEDMANNYFSNDKMRADFVEAYRQAKKEGIVKKDIDIEGMIKAKVELQKKQESVQQGDQMIKPAARGMLRSQYDTPLVSCRIESSRNNIQDIASNNFHE